MKKNNKNFYGYYTSETASVRTVVIDSLVFL
jgi:hypothetical protein